MVAVVVLSYLDVFFHAELSGMPMKEDVVSMSLQLCELDGTIDSLNDSMLS